MYIDRYFMVDCVDHSIKKELLNTTLCQKKACLIRYFYKRKIVCFTKLKNPKIPAVTRFYLIMVPFCIIQEN